MSQGQGGGPKPIVLTDEQIIQVEALGATLSMAQIADYFGVSWNAFQRIMERQPEVMKRYKIGKSNAIQDVAKGLIAQAREGNTTAAIFYLKTQAGWKETSIVENTGKDGGPIDIKTLNTLSDEELYRIATGSRKDTVAT